MNEEIEYDESKAVEYINNALQQKGRPAYDEDDLLLLIDAMFDYYEAQDDDTVLTEDEENAQLLAYVTKALHNDKDNKIADTDIADIIEAELQYEDTLSDI